MRRRALEGRRLFRSVNLLQHGRRDGRAHAGRHSDMQLAAAVGVVQEGVRNGEGWKGWWG
jgi:hypothetical protein